VCRALASCTTKPDKYDRYLADVFLRPATGESSRDIEREADGSAFLNNALLAHGHAVNFDGTWPEAAAG